MDNQKQQQRGRTLGLIHESQIPSGGIKPNHLAASTTQGIGDIYYVNASGIFQKLPIGTAGQKLTVVNGLPAWA